ncbi:zinc finger CCCH domain-containing protein 34-like [Silene latifolia]|uniref:zinc finger CCCH domain-containing protein 34-like n=1 Tax=Silene latifolia TaxID=37657 RepID=UPI003D779615
MDRHGSTDEGTHIDQGVETDLQEGVWQLSLGETTSYPERPGDPDCIYYLRTGFCGYGDRCRFNHPSDRSTSPVAGGGVRMSGADFPERSGTPICQYYMRTGSCKFGTSCKYHHPRQGTGSVTSFGLNLYGYPMRPGEKECTYYMKMGQCKFGITCKFHHPQPANVPMPTAVPPVPAAASAVYPIPSPAPQPYGVIPGDWSVMRPSMIPGSFQGPYGPMLLSPGVVPIPGWSPYPAPNPVATPTNPSAMGTGQLYGVTQLSALAPAYTGSYQALSYANPSSSILKESSFPQRPGQPECQYYLKTGECKFGSSCKYHHPAEWVAPESSSALSPMGLPLRPGTPTCSYYATHGVCKYGPACKFDHPMGTLSYSPSASSLSDMPVVPYPVGSLAGTLAASSSSSDLRAETISGPTKDSASTMTSSVSVSTGSGGSVSSRSGSISQSGVQQSTQKGATPSSGTKTTDLGGASS